MRRFAVVAVIFVSLACAAQTAAPPTSGKKFVPVTQFDPKRDAARDVAAAVAEAGRTGKNVIVDIGGAWCVWCTYFDRFFEENVQIRDFRDQNFVVVKVNFSKENKNEKVISSYGKVPGYPHLFILDGKGKLLYSQDTSKLEQGKGYSPAAVATMLHDWAPGSKPTADTPQ